MKFKILFLSIFFTQVAWPAEWSEIEGIYAITAENLIDPAENEQKDSHYRIQLTGASAKDLYTTMKTDPVDDECPGRMFKNALVTFRNKVRKILAVGVSNLRLIIGKRHIAYAAAGLDQVFSIARILGRKP